MDCESISGKFSRIFNISSSVVCPATISFQQGKPQSDLSKIDILADGFPQAPMKRNKSNIAFFIVVLQGKGTWSHPSTYAIVSIPMRQMVLGRCLGYILLQKMFQQSIHFLRYYHRHL